MAIRTSLRTKALIPALALGAALAAAAPPLAEAAPDAFYGERRVALGDTVSAVLRGTDGETHLYSFFATAGTRVSATLTPASGSNVVASMRLVRPGGTVVPTGSRLRSQGGRSTLSSFRVPYAGWFSIEVTAARGTGEYRLKTSGSLASRVFAVAPRAESGENSWEFRGVAGATANVSIRARGSSRAVPEIRAIVAPDGTFLPIAAAKKGRAAVVDGVELPDHGAYRILWDNSGPAGDVNVVMRFANPAPTKAKLTLGASAGLPATLVDSLNTNLTPGQAAAGFVGSAACGQCHDEIFRGWAETVHNLAVRDWRRPGITGAAFVNDADGNGVDDFRDGLDLVTTAAFAAYGANAPRLWYVSGAEYPYKMTIGTVTYDVARTMGGNGQWKQRYLLLVDGHLYPSPVQYNDGPLSPAGSARYVTYDVTDWYTGTTPNFTAPGQISREKSFENRCSGCHNTGETITRTAAGDYVTGYTDFNIGCEQCHGPAAEHVADPLEKKPVNPRDFVDGTAEGVRAANDVCGKCHTRGAARDTFPGLDTAKAGFPYSRDVGIPHVRPDGIDLTGTFDPTTSSADFWGRKTNPFAPLPGDTWVASKSHRQQALDMQMGSHASDVPYGATCFDCHDPHFRRQKHQIASSHVRENADKARLSAADTVVPTASDDNSLCLACHAGHGPYASVTPEQVAQIAGGAAPQAVVDAVVAHMKDVGMPVAATAYAPTTTRVGQCVACHMPMLEKTAVSGTDPAGFRVNDEHVHTFQTVNPRTSRLYKDGAVGMSNSCNVCHPTSGNDKVDDIIAQWAADGSDADGTFHSDTPRNFQNGIANAGRNGGVYCVQCHTTEGFRRVQVEGGLMDQATADRIVKQSIQRDKGIGCDACHGAQADGTFLAGTNPLRFPKKDLCGKCHNNQTVVYEDFDARGEMVRHPQREMYASTAGTQVPGQTYGTGNPHRGGAFANDCVNCHYSTSVAGATHVFSPQIAVCQNCHGEVSGDFDRPGQPGRDWDGDAVVEGFQTEVSGLLDKLKAGMLAADANLSFASSGYFEYAGATDHKLTGAPAALKRAAFNWYSVSYDASRGVHNPTRSVQLLQKSVKEVTGVDASTDLK